MRPKPPFETFVLYEDNHLLVVNKPAGLLAQGDASGEPTLLDLAKAWLRERHGKPGNVYLGLVHRLDRDVSGVLVLARTSKAASRLSQQIRERTVRKLYRAVVEGRFSAETRSVMDLVRDGARTRQARPGEPGAQRAELVVRPLAHDARATLVEVELVTGRKHQIRAQLEALGHPIAGDRRYGGPPCPDLTGIALYARELTLNHPTRGDRLTFEAPPPPGWPWPGAELRAEG